MSEIVSVFKDISQLNPIFRDQITNFSFNQVAANVFDEPDKLADFAAAVSTCEVQELQDVLESLVVDDRLRKANNSRVSRKNWEWRVMGKIN